MGDVVDLEKWDVAHGNAACFAGGRDTSLQQPGVLGIDVGSRAFVVRVWDVDSANLDPLSLLNLGADTVGGVTVSFGHDGGGERGLSIACEAHLRHEVNGL